MTAPIAKLKVLAQENVAYLASFIVGVVYFIQSWIYAHHQISVLDEGAYLVKGYLFATGRYAPFQNYGPLTNHMPLAFLIPGWVQVLFEPGLRTGRYFAIFLGLLMLVGLWLLVKRLRGPWWAVAAIGIIVVNPALVKMFSIGVSQVLISCLMVWMLYFSLGPKQNEANLIVASLLASAIWFTRINMAPVLLLLLAYIYLEYGWRTFLKCAIAGFGSLLLGHLLYWPGILKLWAYWLPEGLTPFLNAWRLPVDSLPRWSPEIDLGGRLNSFLQAVRFNFVPIIGIISGGLLWNKTYGQRRKSEKLAMLFLSTLFVVLFLMHAVASLGGNYCVYCFQVYLGFFDVLSIVFFVLAFSYWQSVYPRRINLTTAILVLAVTAAIGFAAAETFPRDLLRPRIIREILELKIFGGSQIWALIQNKFGMDFQASVDWARRGLLVWIPVLIGLTVGVVILLISWRLARRTGLPVSGQRFGFVAWSWSLLVLIAVVLSPTKILGAGYTDYDCWGDVISSYEAAGDSLAHYVEPGKLVYWTGGDSAVPLLYITGVKIFPAQLNDGYSFRIGGDSGKLDLLSYWNEDLRTQWLQKADYLLIEDQYYDEYWVGTGDWSHLAETPPTDNCREGAGIHILRRNNQ